jgi:hypothetical protein
MDEIYRMLGREHEADLAREAAKFARADLVRDTPWWRRGMRALTSRKRRHVTSSVSPPEVLDKLECPLGPDRRGRREQIRPGGSAEGIGAEPFSPPPA